MKNKEIDVIALFKGVWRYKRNLFKWGAIGLVVGVVVAFSIPREYRTTVQLAAENKNNNSLSSFSGLASMAGINMNANAQSGIDEKLYPEIVKSTPFLAEFVAVEVEYDHKKTTLYDYLLEDQKAPWWSYVFGFPGAALNAVKGWFSDTKPYAEVPLSDSVALFELSPKQRAFINALSSRIEVKPNTTKGTIEVSAKMQDPVVAAVVADSLVDKLQQYINRYQTNKARADLDNTLHMLEQAKAKYYEIDDRYAQTVDRNNNLIAKTALVRLERLDNERKLAYSVYQQLATQAETYRMKVQEETVIATVVEPALVSDRPDSPNKKMIIAGTAFLFGFIYLIILLIRELNNK